MLGHLVYDYLRNKGKYKISGLGKDTLDATKNKDEIEKILSKFSLDYVINCMGLINKYADTNPEVMYARENGIELEHFPRLLEKYFIKKNSIVIAGTYGKTSITAMVAWLFESANKNPSYMLGGLPLNFNHGARLTKTNISIVEGDEYPAASPWDYSSKFDFYHPKYLILTSAGALNLSQGASSTWTLNDAVNALNIDSNTISIDASNNRVGIGTTSPSAKLDIGGGVVTYIDGVDDLLVKDDLEVDGTIYGSVDGNINQTLQPAR